MITIIILISTSIFQGVAAVPSTTRTYKNFGLGFQIEYPSNMTSNAGSNFTTINNPNPLNKSDIWFGAFVSVTPWSNYMRGLEGLQGLFTLPNLDTLARQTALSFLNQNDTVTNKTQLIVDNTSAYLLQVKHQLTYNQTAYLSVYVMLKGNIVYVVTFAAKDLPKFLPIERMMMRSFRFI